MSFISINIGAYKIFVKNIFSFSIAQLLNQLSVFAKNFFPISNQSKRLRFTFSKFLPKNNFSLLKWLYVPLVTVWRKIKSLRLFSFLFHIFIRLISRSALIHGSCKINLRFRFHFERNQVTGPLSVTDWISIKWKLKLISSALQRVYLW